MLNESNFNLDSIKVTFRGYSKSETSQRIRYIQNEYNKLAGSLDLMTEKYKILEETNYNKSQENYKLEQSNNLLEDEVNDLKEQLAKAVAERDRLIQEFTTFKMAASLTEVNTSQFESTTTQLNEDKINTETIEEEKSTSYSSLSLKSEDNDEDDEDVFIGEVETKQNITDEKFMISDGDDDSTDFEFL